MFGILYGAFLWPIFASEQCSGSQVDISYCEGAQAEHYAVLTKINAFTPNENIVRLKNSYVAIDGHDLKYLFNGYHNMS